MATAHTPRAATRRQALRIAVAGALLPALPLAAGLAPRRASAAPVFPADYAIRYAVAAPGLPEGGSHRLSVARGAGVLLARSESRLLLPRRDGPPVPFVHFCEETWDGGWLHGLVSDTRIGPVRHRVRAWRRGDALRGTRDGYGFSISGYLLTASAWHRDTPTADGLVDPVDGKVKRVRGARRGRESVETGWGPRAAERWTLAGELSRELWYDAGGRLLRFALPAPGDPGAALVATAAELEA
jgi:hypothetical protein